MPREPSAVAVELVEGIFQCLLNPHALHIVVVGTQPSHQCPKATIVKRGEEMAVRRNEAHHPTFASHAQNELITLVDARIVEEDARALTCHGLDVVQLQTAEVGGSWQ